MTIQNKKVFLTGGRSFVGSAVARECINSGAKLSVLLQQREDHTPDLLENLSYQKVYGDIFQIQTYEDHLKNVDVVVHCFEDYRTWAPNPNEVLKNNLEGTKCLLGAVSNYPSVRVVYLSRVGALGRLPGVRVADENTPVSYKDMVGRYQSSKFLAEQVVLEFVDKGLDAVIVNPSACIGERDIQPTPIGKLLIRFVKGEIKGLIDAGRNFTDVQDVAKGILLAAEKGTTGERYILSGHNLSIKAFLSIISSVTNAEVPKKQFPWVFAYFFAFISTMKAKLTGKPPRLSLEAALASRQKLYFDASKAKAELGWQAGPLEPAIERALIWFKDNGYFNKEL